MKEQSDQANPLHAVQASGDSKKQYVKKIFDDISNRYDLVNELISLGGTTRWRRRALMLAKLPKIGRLLDIGTGTGDIPCELARLRPNLKVDGIDISQQMLGIAKRKCEKANFFVSDATCISADDESYDAVTNAYVLRNVQDLEKALGEMVRVMKPGGVLMSLDTFAPGEDCLMHGLMRVWLKHIVPNIAGMFTMREPYQYLAESIIAFEKRKTVRKTLESLGCKVEMHEIEFCTVVCVIARKGKTH